MRQAFHRSLVGINRKTLTQTFCSFMSWALSLTEEYRFFRVEAVPQLSELSQLESWGKSKRKALHDHNSITSCLIMWHQNYSWRKRLQKSVYGAPFSLDAHHPLLPLPAVERHPLRSCSWRVTGNRFDSMQEIKYAKTCQDHLLTNGHWDWNEVALANHLAIIQN